MSVRKRKETERSLNERLGIAVARNNIRNMEALLAEGANPTSSYEDGDPIMFNASIPILQRLLDEGATIDQPDEEGRTLLSYLCHWHDPNNRVGGENETERIRFVLEKGADPNLADKDGMTPLHHLCMQSMDPMIIRILIENGADVNQIDNIGDTPLHKIGKRRDTRAYPLSVGEGAIQTLLGARANPLLKNNAGHTASELAEEHEVILPLIRLLKQAERNAGANVNVPELPAPRNANAVNAVNAAVRANNREQLRNQILAMGNAQNEFNEIPGMNQAEFEHLIANPLQNNMANAPAANAVNHIPHNAGNVNLRGNAAPAAGGRRKSRKAKKARKAHKTRKERKARKGRKSH